MNQYGFPESDWKLYKSKIGGWQEGYMEKLCKEYIELLSSDKLPSDRFWELDKRIKTDRQATGVTRNQARAIEQYYIKNGPNELNKINSISTNHRFSQKAMNWAEQYIIDYGMTRCYP